ncbi:unnamed protein product, partial [marine sediment metagenome]
MELCDMCGRRIEGRRKISGAIVCRICAVDLRIEMDKLHAEGKPVDGLKIAREIFRRTYTYGDYLIRDIPAE